MADKTKMIAIVPPSSYLFFSLLHEMDLKNN